MRGGLDDALDKLARRDELRRRAAGEATGTPPAVTELIEAIVGVVGRHPALAVTVGVEGAGDPTLLHFGVEDGIVQVNADHRVAARAAEEAPARHADFDFDLELDEPEEPPGSPAPAYRHVSYDDRNRYDPGTGYDSALYDGPTAPVHTPPRQHADPGTSDGPWVAPPDEDRTRRIFPQPPGGARPRPAPEPDEAAYPRAGARPAPQQPAQPAAHHAGQRPHPAAAPPPQRPAAAQHRQGAEQHRPASPAADRPHAGPPRPHTGVPHAGAASHAGVSHAADRPQSGAPHAGPPHAGGPHAGSPPHAGAPHAGASHVADRPQSGAPQPRTAPEHPDGRPTAGGPASRADGARPQRGMPAPLPEPIPLQVDPEEAEMAAKRLAALLREDPTLLRRAPRA